MKLYCRSCENLMEVKPDELIGRYFVCTQCRSLIRWEVPAPGDHDGDASGQRADRCRRTQVD